MSSKELSDPRAGRARGPQGAVPALSSVGARQFGKPAQRPPSAAPPARVCGNAEAVAAVLYSLSFGEAPCIGIVGDRGTGKSTAMKAICAEYLRRSVGLVLACDKGGKSGFIGQRRVDVADLGAHPMEPSPRAVVFTGDPFTGVDPDPEAVAEFGWKLAARGVPVLIADDELKWAAKNGWWRKGVKWLPQCCSEGRKHGVGFAWASQSPQDAPREPFEESGSLITYRLAGLGLDRLEERGYLRGIDRAVIEGLPGDKAPPAERGRCVLLQRGEVWDGKFYRFAV